MPIKKPNKATIKDQVYEIIREMILRQEYRLGEKINIDTLAATLNVSNSPIREALNMLEKQGIVENIPNIGSHVVTFSTTAYREISDSMHLVLSGSYDICLRQNTIDDAIRNMRDALRMQKSTVDSKDLYAFMKHTLAFDKSIVCATQNSYLLSIYERMEDIYFLIVLYSHQRSDDEHRENLFEHSMILENIEKGDSAAVKAWLQVHYDKRYDS